MKGLVCVRKLGYSFSEYLFNWRTPCENERVWVAQTSKGPPLKLTESLIHCVPEPVSTVRSRDST